MTKFSVLATIKKIYPKTNDEGKDSVSLLLTVPKVGNKIPDEKTRYPGNLFVQFNTESRVKFINDYMKEGASVYVEGVFFINNTKEEGDDQWTTDFRFYGNDITWTPKSKEEVSEDDSSTETSSSDSIDVIKPTSKSAKKTSVYDAV